MPIPSRRRIDRRNRQPTPSKRLEILARLRRDEVGLDPVLGTISKVKLANELWPVLERKIERARLAGTQERIPIVRVLYLAYRLALELPQQNLVIQLDP